MSGMLGLMKKDLYLLKASLKARSMILVMLVIYFVAAGSGDSIFTFIPTYIVFMSMLSTFSYDEYNQFDAFAVSLPNGRKNVVRAKYVVTLLISAITALLTVLISGVAGLIFGRGLELSGLLESFIGAMCALLILQALFYPLIFKFGINKGRVMVFVLAMAVGALIFLLSQMNGLPKIDAGILDRYFAVLMPLLLLALMGLSYLISQRIYGKKQF